MCVCVRDVRVDFYTRDYSCVNLRQFDTLRRRSIRLRRLPFLADSIAHAHISEPHVSVRWQNAKKLIRATAIRIWIEYIYIYIRAGKSSRKADGHVSARRRHRWRDEICKWRARDTAVNHPVVRSIPILDITQSKWMRSTSKINHFMPYVLAAGASDFRRRCSRAVVALYFFIRWKRKKKQKTMKYSIRAVVNKQTNKKMYIKRTNQLNGNGEECVWWAPVIQQIQPNIWQANL